MVTNEYDWQLGELAAQDVYPDERGLQPPAPDDPWPQQFLPSPGDPAPWRPEPTRLARWPADPEATAFEAAAERTRAPYRNAIARDPTSNRMGALAEFVAPQSPIDYALMGAGPVAKVASVPVRAAIYGGAMALDPSAAEASFAGKLSKTANLDLMKKAEEMLKYGKNPVEVRKETGWFPTAGGILKYEIPDYRTGWEKGREPSKILRQNLPASATQGQVYRHPELWEAYPPLAESPLVITKDLGKGTRGAFQPPLDVTDPMKFFLAPGAAKSMRSANLHELGHGVQHIEDWPVGGNPMRPIKEGTPQWDIYQRMLKEATAPMSREEFFAMAKDTGLEAPANAYEKYLDEFKNFKLSSSTDDKIRRLAAFEAYRKSAGEVEARNIQARADFTKAQRESIPPHVSQDVPYHSQIIERRERPLPDIPDDLAMGNLAGMQLARQEKPAGFAPGSVLTPEARAALPKNWRDLPGENAPFPQYAEQYPPVGPPTMVPKDNPKFKGETYPEKTLTPEGEAFVKARNKIMADMKKSGYEPYYDPSKRYYADPSKYPAANVDTLTVTPKKAETIAEYEKVVNTPETRRLLREAFARGEKLGNADHWYAMGQLEGDYIKELGAKAGRKAFLEEFAVPMAATTSGNKPINNLLMSHYFEVLRKKGEPIPEGHQFPPPVGGRRANVNVRDYESVMEGGGYSALGAGQPKMHNFSRSFIGDLSRAVMDEQMAGGSLAGQPKEVIDRVRTTGFGLLEKQLHIEAARKKIQPGNFQDVAWAGFKNEAGRPMITEINEAIERTHRLTGMPRSEIVRRGLVRKEIPLYGTAGAAVMGGLAAQDQYD